MIGSRIACEITSGMGDIVARKVTVRVPSDFAGRLASEEAGGLLSTGAIAKPEIL